MENTDFDYRQINGWGIDADPENEPTYPMKKYTGDDHNRLNYERPPQQETEVEILHSNERPNLPAVIGTTVPPSGLSGIIRRFAFKHSENQYAHWLPLLIADRINVWEGIIQDLSRGRIPNLIKEHGLKSEWKYNKKGFIAKAAVRVAVVAVIVLVIFNKKKRSTGCK